MDKSLFKIFFDLNLVGSSTVFVEALSSIQKLSNCDIPVLIQGETGTGKENAARAIHYLGSKTRGAFVPINCGALTDELLESELFGHKKGAFTDAKADQLGLVELADGGTLFLDEVDSLSHKAQTTLLRFLQSHEFRSIGDRKLKKVNLRVISASNANFESAIYNKLFREDLFYRLNVLNITLPPLRDRATDIAPIAHSLLKKFSQQYSCPNKALSPSAVSWLEKQKWNGNVRELENTLLREIIFSEGNVITFLNTHENTTAENTSDPWEHFDQEGHSFREAKACIVKEFEKKYLCNLLQKTCGNISEAARISGKERRAVGKMIKKYNIDREVFSKVDTKERS